MAQVLDDEFTTARIVSARPDGSGLRALIHPAAGEFDLNAIISPDGSRVVFERDLADGSAQIHVVGADGRGEHALDLGCVDPCAADLDPGWTQTAGASPSPRVIGPLDQVNDSARSAVLHTANLDGSGVRRLSEPGIDGVFEDYRARFAPGGRYLIFVRSATATSSRPCSGCAPTAPTSTNSPLAAGRRHRRPVAGHPRPNQGPGGVRDLRSRRAGRSPVGRRHRPGDLWLPRRLHQQDPLRDPQRGRPRDQLQPILVAGRNPDRIHQRAPAPNPDGPAISDIWTVRPGGGDRRRVSHSPRFEFRPDWGVAA